MKVLIELSLLSVKNFLLPLFLLKKTGEKRKRKGNIFIFA